MSSCQGRDQWLEEILNLQDVMSYTQRIRDLFRKYGKVGLGVHLAIYTATLSGLLGFQPSKSESRLYHTILPAFLPRRLLRCRREECKAG